MAVSSNHQTLRAQTANSFEALDARVLGLEDDVRNLDRKLDTGMASLRSDFAAAISGIHAKLDRQAQPQWGVIYAGVGVLVAFLSVIGGLAYMPIREGLHEIRVAHANSVREAKQDRKDEVESLVRRDQRIWDSVLKIQSQVDRLEAKVPPLSTR